MGRPPAERADADPARRRRGEGHLSLPRPLLVRLKAALGPDAGAIVILDFDGTLTPIVASPQAARLGAATRAALEALARHPRVGLAVLSGRALADVRRRVGVAGVVYGGCHGLQIAGAGLRFRHPSARRGRVTATARTLAAAVRRIPGARIEGKGLAVSLHYRGVAGARVEEVRDVVDRVVRWAPDLAVIAGHKVFDFVPRLHWNKGTAAGWIAARLAGRLPPRPTVIYIGDDTTDETAFVALRRLRAVTVRVGLVPTVAEHAVRGVREVHALLRSIIALLR